MLIASQSPRVTLHHGSVNFILHGSCALGDGFHLNWGVLRAVHLRTLDNSSILVHVTNKFHETIHYHPLAVEKKEKPTTQDIISKWKESRYCSGVNVHISVGHVVQSRSKSRQIVYFEENKWLMVVNCSLLAIHVLMIINCSVQKFSLNKQRPLWQATFSIIGLRYLKEDEGVTNILSFSDVFFLSFLCFSVLFFSSLKCAQHEFTKTFMLLCARNTYIHVLSRFY